MDLLGSVPVQLFYTILGALVLFTIQWGWRHAQRLRRRTLLESTLSATRNASCLDLANGIPEYASANLNAQPAGILGRVYEFVLAPPAGHALLDDRPQLTFAPRSVYFHEGVSLESWAEQMEIADLGDRISLHSQRVYQDFLQRSDGQIFNGEKWGLYDFVDQRVGRREDPGADIKLFRTDYFTHRVMKSIYRELIKEQPEHPIAHVTGKEAVLRFRPFLTSIGVNCLVICRSDNLRASRSVVLSRRSGSVSGTGGQLHVTMNEGLSQTDEDPQGGISLELCLRRGLREELGIDDRIFTQAALACFYDFFLVRADFEIGVTSVIELEVMWSQLSDNAGRDKALEISGFTEVPFTGRDLRRVLDSDSDPVTSACAYALRRVAARNGLVV